MHPGVDTSRFVPAPPRPEVRHRLGWTERRVMLTVGALQKRKGQDMLIRALPTIRARCPDVHSIVGAQAGSPYLDAVRRPRPAPKGSSSFAEASGRGVDRGLSTVRSICAAKPPVGWDFEGFGIVLLEAQACGKPVIAGLSGGTPETIQPSRTGELVDCDTRTVLPETAADSAWRSRASGGMGARAPTMGGRSLRLEATQPRSR